MTPDTLLSLCLAELRATDPGAERLLVGAALLSPAAVARRAPPEPCCPYAAAVLSAPTTDLEALVARLEGSWPGYLHGGPVEYLERALRDVCELPERTLGAAVDAAVDRLRALERRRERLREHGRRVVEAMAEAAES